MSASAIIMAGGRGSRMRESGYTEPKPLVRVGGVPLIERNLFALLRHNFHQIYVAVAANAEQLRAWLLTRGTALAGATGADLRVVEESIPLGSIGAAALAGDDSRELLVVFADNLTALDLRALVEHHQRGNAAMTMAVHEHPFRIPFGVPEIRGSQVIAFREKPTSPVLVCSGVYVLGSEALDLLPHGEPCGAPALIDRLLAAGRTITPYVHRAAWIDVNDRQSQIAAEQLLAANPDLDRWAPSYECEVVVALLFGQRGLLLKWRGPDDAHADGWNMPRRIVKSGESLFDALHGVLREQFGLREPNARVIGSFDDIDMSTARILRYYVFAVAVEDGASVRDGRDLRWFIVDDLPEQADVDVVVTRSLALWSSQRSPSPP
jgi:dTDP-glucose pyrophosphorylase/ADP-ribose pyrophosphatase YjhB (NUDIX family)